MFDVDFADRDVIIDYLMKKYGANNVAAVGAFGKLTLPNCVRRVMSAFNVPSSTINAISKTLESNWSVEEGIKNSKLFADYAKTHIEEIHAMKKILGIVGNYSTHAGGIIIYKGLTDILPVRTMGDDRTRLIVTLEKQMLEKLGQIKYDILGLENLTVVRDTLDSIKAETGYRPVLTSEDMNDGGTYEMLSNGDVSGVFQLSNQAHMLKIQKPKVFSDLIAINAIIRP